MQQLLHLQRDFPKYFYKDVCSEVHKYVKANYKQEHSLHYNKCMEQLYSQTRFIRDELNYGSDFTRHIICPGDWKYYDYRPDYLPPHSIHHLTDGWVIDDTTVEAKIKNINYDNRHKKTLKVDYKGMHHVDLNTIPTWQLQEIVNDDHHDTIWYRPSMDNYCKDSYSISSHPNLRCNYLHACTRELVVRQLNAEKKSDPKPESIYSKIWSIVPKLI